MTTFFAVMSALIVTGLGITISFFRKGGVYNPVTSLDNETHIDIVPEVPILPSTATSTVSSVKPTVEAFCLAIRDFEGAPGDANYRNNNPGNCRYNPSGYMPMYGKVGRSKNGFAIFPTYDLGWKYLINMVKGMIHKRPNETILQFMTRYAPESDNNPTKKYAQFIAKRLGVDIAYKMGNLV